MAEPVEVSPGRYYDPASGMYWTESTGWYYSSGGDDSGGPAVTQSTGDPVADAIARALAEANKSSGVTYGEPYYDAAGNYVQDGSNGTIRVINARQTGGTSVHINPADSTGAWSIQYDSNGQGFKVNKITGEVVPLDFDKTPGGSGNDPDGDGYDNKTGLPNGVVTIGGKFYYQGKQVNADGSLYTGSAGGKQEILVDRDGRITGRPGTSYYFDETGTPHTLVTGPTPSSSSGGGGSGSSSSGGGGSSSGGGSSTPANRTTTTIREGGFNDTNLNISELGPEYMANAAAERGMTGLQTAGSLQQKLSEMLDSRTNNIIQNLSNPSDIVAREYSTRGLGNPQGTATPMYGDTNTISEIIARLMEGNPGLASALGSAGGSGGAGTTGGGTTGTPASPVTTPSTPTTPASGVISGNGASTPISSVIEGSGVTTVGTSPRGGVGGMTSGSYGGVPYTATRPGGNLRYPDTVVPTVDPRIAAQATDDRQRDTTVIPYGNDSITKPLSETVSGMPPIRTYANGGATDGTPFIAGDPQANGKPNPELVIPNGPSTVVPLQDMPQGISQMLMQSVPKHGYGSVWDNPQIQGTYTGASTGWGDSYNPNPPDPAPIDYGFDPIFSQPAQQPTQIPYSEPVNRQTASTIGTAVQQPQPISTAIPNTPTKFGDWRDQLPPATTTVPTSTTTPSSASGVQAPVAQAPVNQAPVVQQPAPVVQPTPAPVAQQPQPGTIYGNPGTIYANAPAPQPAPQPVAQQPTPAPQITPTNASNASPAPVPAQAPAQPQAAAPANTTGLGIHPYNGQPADTIMSYPDSAYQNLPTLLFAQGKIPLSEFLASQTGGAAGAFGTNVPYSGDMNYNKMLNIQRIPGSYGALSSLYKSANMSLDDEIAKARGRAPLGNAVPISGIMT